MAQRASAAKPRGSGRPGRSGRRSDVYFETPTLKIIRNDLFLTDAIAANSIDLIVTSPPYNVDIPYATHDDDVHYEEYLEFSLRWLKRCRRWLKSDGRLCLNVPLDKNKGGQKSVGADLTGIAKQAEYGYHSTIVWNEGNISRRTAWGSWMSASAPYVIAPVELIVVLYKREWKKVRADAASDITRDDFMAWTNGLWTFPGESKKRIGHPAPFPVELPHRCIKLFSFVGDTVLDPFMGSGTTLVAASRNNRKAIGIEMADEYCALARGRLTRDAKVPGGAPRTGGR